MPMARTASPLTVTPNWKSARSPHVTPRPKTVRHPTVILMLKPALTRMGTIQVTALATDRR